MKKSLYEQLKEADKNIARMTPDIWYNIGPQQNHGIVHGAQLVNCVTKKSNKPTKADH